MENTDRNETVLRKISEAFLGSFSSIYYVDAETNEYQWYSVSDDFRSLRIEQSGDDFFANMARDARKVICPEDQHLFTEDLDREALLNAEVLGMRVHMEDRSLCIQLFPSRYICILERMNRRQILCPSYLF